MDDVGAKESDAVAQEARKHPRQAIELEVEYTRLNSFFSDYAKNISKGGTFIKTAKPLKIGTEFLFKLRVPRFEEPLRLLGRVQWVVTESDVAAGDMRGGGDPGMGIHFLFEDETERQQLVQRVEKIMVDSLGQLLYSKLMEQKRS